MQLTRQFCLELEVGKVKTKRHFFGSFRIYSPGLVLLGILFNCNGLHAQPSAGAALRFGSTNAVVQVAHNTNFNSYPFTVTAWFRTISADNNAQGIVSKYVNGSGNGWALVVQNGKLRGFQYRSFANLSIDATSLATVSDGYWHHAALVVDASGGKMYLDGVA